VNVQGPTSTLVTARVTGKTGAQPTVLTLRVQPESSPEHFGVYRQPIQLQ